MLKSLIISHILLWLLVISLTIVCLALVRQLGVVYERIAPAGALALNRVLKSGEPAPVITASTLDGTSITIGKPLDPSTERRSRLFFFLSPTCPICKALLPILKSVQRSERSWLDIILASDGSDARRHRSFIQKFELADFPYVVSEPLGIAYGVSKLPYAVLIDDADRIVAFGIVNSREHLESLFEAKRLNADSIQTYMQTRHQA